MDCVSYHRLARRELNEAAQYYESESPGLGSAFLDEVERCTQVIANFPEAGPLITETIRRRLLLRFPYALLYTIKSDRVRVLAVMNLKRRPMYWVGRE
ncbi:MAG: type II toxin-antitoxin system RelE/ParE family toxin [Nitrospira sp.]|nr:type II toxin-antitoxin system RelE/ParE family toxin [Nitrospira sp.]MDH4369180.1 type II toxin-antitoxin system RelE/ParE family toxin [Nitrospira sp.]MDH5348637.1 type II toxin-antitoxin system RelE/ParE family toxin [Nitrospira sp.]MDH5498433.1 type II toxin-antitoxin system RelE/ParE family toxin [Nitrospira sp.]